MTTNKDTPTVASQPGLECCMCGDYGFSYELFQCKVCEFRSQHRYCSNLYPKAESYRICNWCLSQKEDAKEKSQNSSNSSSSNKNQGEDDSKSNRRNGNGDNLANLKGQRDTSQLKLNVPIKKQRSPDGSPSPSPSPSARKRIITNARMEEKLRRTKSEEISNRIGVTRPLLRSKVRRYKLLDEVSS
ncbi:hypothetical protein I3843_07G165900 [Carya illinoinensis]|uniref:PHD-type zinc finger plants domain-containing protein n=1 Tax=Carya illinoinensis TaxID=32201 RepID=A0A8T1Q3W6_CARIL|nr:translation initiation factor IF-2-like isoform X1 [Carya illinoinensis]KAG2698815.1 hypothetical protein I3760_07G165900 [Carya illinoinensis]KAG6648767.1 hypothetical protein CIPAW_07G168400 [Carya illinoinensis]KAG6705249.1 hypothetical protein I3842_07G171000 [Carya illinoinensis]KAG7972083.1 hypothetical protein I3843_07G165900 [Carya illinoinensis]